MDIEFFFPDTIEAMTSNGETLTGLRAQFTSKKSEVTIHGNTHPIDEGSVLTRKVPSGLTEQYDVLEVHSSPGYLDLPAILRLKVSKRGSRVPQTGPRTIHLHGTGNRVNVNSTDHSTNVINVDHSRVFNDLRQTIQKEVADEELKAKVLTAIDDLESSKGTETYFQKFQAFSALTANLTTIVMPYVPALMEWIKKHPL